MTDNPSLNICILTFNRPVELLQCVKSLFNSLSYYESKADVSPDIMVKIKDQSNGASITPELEELVNTNDNAYIILDADIGPQKTILDFYWNLESEYGWFISDDDLVDESAIIDVFSELKKYKPDLCLFNYDIFKKDRKKIKMRSALGKYRMVCDKNRFLENFHIHPAMPSNVIIKKGILRTDIALTEELLQTEISTVYILYASLTKDSKCVFSPTVIVGYRASNAVQNYDWDFVFACCVPKILRTLSLSGYPNRTIKRAIIRTFLRYIIPEIFYKTLKLQFQLSRILYFYHNYNSKDVIKIEYKS